MRISRRDTHSHAPQLLETRIACVIARTSRRVLLNFPPRRAGRIAAEQIAEGIRKGAPTLYRPELAELSRRLALLGATDQEMADALGIDQVTLDRWKTRHKEFGIATQHDKIKADAEIAESLYNRALGYTHEAMKIFS